MTNPTDTREMVSIICLIISPIYTQKKARRVCYLLQLIVVMYIGSQGNGERKNKVGKLTGSDVVFVENISEKK
jgi:hypothetical protein